MTKHLKVEGKLLLEAPSLQEVERLEQSTQLEDYELRCLTRHYRRQVMKLIPKLVPVEYPKTQEFPTGWVTHKHLFGCIAFEKKGLPTVSLEGVRMLARKLAKDNNSMVMKKVSPPLECYSPELVEQIKMVALNVELPPPGWVSCYDAKSLMCKLLRPIEEMVDDLKRFFPQEFSDFLDVDDGLVKVYFSSRGYELIMDSLKKLKADPKKFRLPVNWMEKFQREKVKEEDLIVEALKYNLEHPGNIKVFLNNDGDPLEYFSNELHDHLMAVFRVDNLCGVRKRFNDEQLVKRYGLPVETIRKYVGLYRWFKPSWFYPVRSGAIGIEYEYSSNIIDLLDELIIREHPQPPIGWLTLDVIAVRRFARPKEMMAVVMREITEERPGLCGFYLAEDGLVDRFYSPELLASVEERLSGNRILEMDFPPKDWIKVDKLQVELFKKGVSKAVFTRYLSNFKAVNKDSFGQFFDEETRDSALFCSSDALNMLRAHIFEKRQLSDNQVE
jgi:hypothetical protein